MIRPVWTPVMLKIRVTLDLASGSTPKHAHMFSACKLHFISLLYIAFQFWKVPLDVPLNDLAPMASNIQIQRHDSRATGKMS